LNDSEAPRWALDHLGTALGLEPGLQFERSETSLRHGDTMIFYSDGVSEAFNSEEECYGNERLMSDLSRFRNQSPREVTSGLLTKVRDFAGNAPQSDDLTILVTRLERSAGAQEEVST
jgi:sigma-B regulation protein RsbU (phosphoserine phosphatase)